MKKVSLVVAIMLAVGVTGCTSTDSQHKDEYVYHVSKAFQSIQFTSEQLQTMDKTWSARTPKEIAGSLFAISAQLGQAQDEVSDMAVYLRNHDDTDNGGNTGDFYYLFHYYKESIDARLQGTWDYTNQTAKVNDQVEFWAKLHQDISTMNQDIAEILQLKQADFEEGKMSTMHDQFAEMTKRLKFAEVMTKYNKGSE